MILLKVLLPLLLVYVARCEGCSKVMCRMLCANGFEKDENGCTICKCKQIPPSDVNWALNKPSTQSSTYGSGSRPDCDARWANDGSMDTRAVTEDRSGAAWWQVDLQQIIKIKDVTLKFNDYPLKVDYYKDVVILTKTSEKGTWTVCKEAGHLTSTPAVIKCDQPTEAQFVRIAMKSKTRLYLGEVEVHRLIDEDTKFKYLGNKDCLANVYTYTHGKKRCDGWKGVTLDECKRSCLKNEVAPSCPRKTCKYIIYFPKTSWCHHVAGDCQMIDKSESQLFELKDVNWALNKPSRQSTTYGSGSRPDCDARWANDGSMNTRAVTRDYSGAAWWQVDLQNVIKIKDITLGFNEYPLKKDYYKNVVILTKTSEGGAWKVCKEAGHLTSTPIVIKCDRPTVAQFVRIALKSKTRLYLGEVEVHGSVDADAKFKYLGNKDCVTDVYTYTHEKEKCNGWRGVTLDECKRSCLKNEAAPSCPRKTCKYIIYYPKTSWCHHAGAECQMKNKSGPLLFELKEVNWAMNKPSTQSSTYGSGSRPDCKAKWANDGSMETRAVTEDRSGAAWWQVNLQKVITIKDITLRFNEYPLKKDYYKNVVILTKRSEEGSWTVCKEAGHLTSTPIVIKCDRPTVAQFIRIALKSETRLYLGEVEVHGSVGEETEFKYLGNKVCVTNVYTYTHGKKRCDGWSGVTLDECKQSCLRNEAAPSCPRKTCKYIIYYPKTSWCHHASADCKVADRSNALLYERNDEYFGEICHRDFRKLGCFSRNWSHLPDLLVTDLDPTHENFTVPMNWDNLELGLHSLACRCREKAKSHYKYFALGFHGECVAGKDNAAIEKLMAEDTTSDHGCINSEFSQCDNSHQKECIGVADYDFIYEITYPK